MSDTVFIIIMLLVCATLMVVEFLLLKKHYELEAANLHAKYQKMIEQTEKDAYEKAKENFTHEPIKVVEVQAHVQEFKKCIDLEDHFNSRFENRRDLDEWLRKEFGRCFAEEVLEPNMDIKEVFDPMSTHRKYATKIYIAFKER